ESRPITVTLPNRVLNLLATIDQDRAKAIVKVAEATMAKAWQDNKRIELVEIERGTAVIVVGPSPGLASIPWLRLIEIAPARYLLALPTGTALEKLEVALMDLIETVPVGEPAERSLLNDLHQSISSLRREEKMTKSEIIFVSMPRRKSILASS
ncbi:MAG: hypothetical protein HY343_07290, partial [Lentisphaerae bacterium]|nr:hypothetical protein [Lentisphaerota bacterium]